MVRHCHLWCSWSCELLLCNVLLFMNVSMDRVEFPTGAARAWEFKSECHLRTVWACRGYGVRVSVSRLTAGGRCSTGLAPFLRIQVSLVLYLKCAGVLAHFKSVCPWCCLFKGTKRVLESWDILGVWPQQGISSQILSLTLISNRRRVVWCLG